MAEWFFSLNMLRSLKTQMSSFQLKSWGQFCSSGSATNGSLNSNWQKADTRTYIKYQNQNLTHLIIYSLFQNCFCWFQKLILTEKTGNWSSSSQSLHERPFECCNICICSYSTLHSSYFPFILPVPTSCKVFNMLIMWNRNTFHFTCSQHAKVCSPHLSWKVSRYLVTGIMNCCILVCTELNVLTTQ